MMGLIQVLSLLSETTKVLFPPQSEAASTETMLVITLDIHRVIQLDYWGFDYYGRWTTTVVTISLTLFGLILRKYAVDRVRNKGNYHQAHEHDDEGLDAVAQAAINIAFFVIILLYPKVSSKIFTLLRCRSRGPIAGVLKADYSTACDSPEYAKYYTFALFLVLVIPVGVPTVLLALLLKSGRRPPPKTVLGIRLP